MQSVTLTSKLTLIAQTVAAAQQLPFQLVRAHIIVESRGDTCAWRCEPGYRYLWDNLYRRAFRELTAEEIASATPPSDFGVPPNLSCSKTTEWWAQRSSWGAMQIMGAAARQHGFTGNLPQLCDSDGSLGVQYGCLQLKAFATRFLATFGWRGVCAAYNAGSPRREQVAVGVGPFVNQVYVDQIAAAGGFEGL